MLQFIVVISIWFILCIILSGFGRRRKIGATKAFFISFFFSPLVGFVKVMTSEKKESFIVIKDDGTEKRVIFEKIGINELYIRRRPIIGGYKVYIKTSKSNFIIMNEFSEFNEAKEYILNKFIK